MSRSLSVFFTSITYFVRDEDILCLNVQMFCVHVLAAAVSFQ